MQQSLYTKIELWPIGRVKPYPKNARKIPQSAIDKVAASIEAFGFRQAIVVDGEGVIIIGHVRRLAALKLKLAEVPVHVAADLDADQVKRLRLADNRTHEEASWDLELLAEEFKDLGGLETNLIDTAFDFSEIERLLREPVEETEETEIPTTAVTWPGDLWRCGDSLVLCGDATDEEATLRLFAAAVVKPVLCVTDPPYGVEYDPAWRNEVLNEKNPNRQTGTVLNDDRVDWTPVYRNFPGDVIYVWHAGVFAGQVGDNLIAAGYDIRAQIIWRKQQLVMSRGAYHWQHEPCWYAVRRGGKANWRGDRKQTTVWDIANLNPFGGDRGEEKVGHGTQKPIECMARPIINHTEPGQFVYDPFLGSGTTLVAAARNDRRFVGSELNPCYVDAGLGRWMKLTGKQALLDGRTWDQVKEERGTV